MASNAEDEQDAVLPNYECRDFNDIATCFGQMHKSIFGKIENIEKRTKTLEEKMESIDFVVQNQNDIIKDITETRLVNIDEKIQEVERNRLALEVWGRKWNLVVRGINGSVNEAPPVTEDKVRGFLSDSLKLDSRRMAFAAVHRLPPSMAAVQAGVTEGTNTPNISIRFVNIHDRDAVMHAAMKELTQGMGKSVVPDLPPQINKIRQTLLLKRKSLSADEKRKVKLVYMKSYPFVALKQRRMRDGDQLNTSIS